MDLGWIIEFLIGFGSVLMGILVGYYWGYSRRKKELALEKEKFSLLLKQTKRYADLDEREDFDRYFEEFYNPEYMGHMSRDVYPSVG